MCINQESILAYKSGNPALSEKTFSGLGVSTNTMSLEGVVYKSFAMLMLCIAAGVFGWKTALSQGDGAGLLLIGSSILGFVVAMVTIFKKTWSPVTAPLYAIVEGFLLGMISQFYNEEFDGIVLQAILLTVGIFLALLILYASKIIRATENFKLGVFAATGGIALFYVATLVLGLFGVDVPLVNSVSGWGIAFSVFVVFIASLNLVVDFDFIESGVKKRAPKYMEWYAGFGLFVTLVWLYLEILRLLGKARSR